jgi:hypothetical protein
MTQDLRQSIDSDQAEAGSFVEQIRALARKEEEELRRPTPEINTEVSPAKAAEAAERRRRWDDMLPRAKRRVNRDRIAAARNPVAAAKRIHKGMVMVQLLSSTTEERMKELYRDCRGALPRSDWDYVCYRHRPRAGARNRTLCAFFFKNPRWATKFKLQHGGCI